MAADYSGLQRLRERPPSNEMSCAMTFDQERGYCDVSVLSNFGPCLIWKRPSTVSQIQPE